MDLILSRVVGVEKEISGVSQVAVKNAGNHRIHVGGVHKRLRYEDLKSRQFLQQVVVRTVKA